MKRILLPIEETTRSLRALTELKANFSPNDYEIILMMIDERIDYTAAREVISLALTNIEQKLDLVTKALEEFTIIRRAETGKAGPKIVQVARELNVDIIMMTKSSKEDMRNALGSTTEYVITHSPSNVLIVEEDRAGGSEYRGLVYRKATAQVTLRGQLSLKQSECLLPSVSTDCIYSISVTRGKVRFLHNSFDKSTMRWDHKPYSGQPESYEIAAGESIDIPVKAFSVEGKSDRIRVINRSMKSEAVFTFKISADRSKNRVILASRNEGKIKEMKAILGKYGMDVVSRDDAGLPAFEVEETGDTFEENSFIKAKAILDIAKCPTIADDSGLVVDALDGAPGVYSARYAGENCSFDDNNRKLLEELKDVPKDKRTARFVSVITMLYPDGRKLVARGECEGTIAEELKGDGGFGYDPIFIPEGYYISFGEMTPEEKNRISHRAQSLKELERLLERK